MNYLLLLGAGFSRNWGGWLANEAFEYLLGCPQIDPSIRQLLWKHPRSGGIVIGYSFGDPHINQTIVSAASQGKLRLFIIDPLGLDVIDENRNAPLHTPGTLLGSLQDHVVGASRRSLRDIFGGDRVEHAKVMRFFA
jgi:hypothetical protein